MLTRLAFLAALAVGCRDGSDTGIEIVRVPQSAYLAPDAAPKGDGAVAATNDAGPDPVVLCISRQDSEDSTEDCPDEHEGRHYDEKATTRHRAKGDDSTVCCYRKGRVPRVIREEE